MTSRTSLFNRGIFSSTVRRYRLGSVLYLILLFLSTGLPILFGVDPNASWVARNEKALILDDIYFYFPLVTAMIVPTVVALLIYRFIHSKKTSIFVHSLPVSRNANYFSSLAAAFTLMATPIVVNGMILMLISVCGYGAVFDVLSCLIWIAANLFAVFLMFSVATLASFLTGNSFAMVALNALIHLIVPILTSCLSALAETFLYGYYESNLLMNAVTKWNFAVAIINLDEWWFGATSFDWWKLVLMLLSAVVLYGVSLLLYRKRRMETAEDVAAYKCLQPIYKYLLAFLAALCSFVMFGNTISEQIWLPVIIVILVSAVVYFAAEMILKKNTKVWRSYRGYLAFLAVFALFLGFFAFTGCFGYETRVPELAEIESAAVYGNRSYEEEPLVADPYVVEYAREVHSELVQKENVYTVKIYPTDRSESFYLTYRLKNGKQLTRRYDVTDAQYCEIFDVLYQSQEYQYATQDVFSDRIGEIYGIELNSGERITDPEKIAGLMECLKADLLALDYTETRAHENWGARLYIEYVPVDEVEKDSRAVYTISERINASFTNTLAWLRGNGYQHLLFNREGADLTVLNAEQWKTYETEQEDVIYEASGYKTVTTVSAKEAKKFEDIPGAVRITDSAKKAALGALAVSTPVRYIPGTEYAYYLCSITEGGYLNAIAAFYDDASGISQYMK